MEQYFDTSPKFPYVLYIIGYISPGGEEKKYVFDKVIILNHLFFPTHRQELNKLPPNYTCTLAKTGMSLPPIDAACIKFIAHPPK